uniref:Uncharacterized protein n=1 Tax=Pristionchus pacificus TaxID=54126 RepID=A0A2A6B984_PRIPA|eukprot:PDM62423.1 hypothetical protein PRIPAC_51865 [Pristionchus pacificus]
MDYCAVPKSNLITLYSLQSVGLSTDESDVSRCRCEHCASNVGDIVEGSRRLDRIRALVLTAIEIRLVRIPVGEGVGGLDRHTINDNNASILLEGVDTGSHHSDSGVEFVVLATTRPRWKIQAEKKDGFHFLTTLYKKQNAKNSQDKPMAALRRTLLITKDLMPFGIVLLMFLHPGYATMSITTAIFGALTATANEPYEYCGGEVCQGPAMHCHEQFSYFDYLST